MSALALAAALLLAPAPPNDMTRSILTDVCLPYVTGESSDTVALEFLGFVETPAPEADTRTFQSEDQGHLLLHPSLPGCGVVEKSVQGKILRQQAQIGVGIGDMAPASGNRQYATPSPSCTTAAISTRTLTVSWPGPGVRVSP